MSEIQKCPNLVRGGGGQHFSKMSQMSFFFSDASPYDDDETFTAAADIPC